MLLKQGAIDQDIVDNMLSWRHTGFGADIGAELQPAACIDNFSRTPQHALLEYMVRAPVADNRITIGDNPIISKADRIHPRHGGNFRIFDPLDFIRHIIAHIPNAHEKSVIYYGWYSNRSRGLRKKQENKQAAPTRDREKETPLEVRRAWADMIQRVYEADPLTCPSCGSEMVIVSFIEDEDVIFKILNHLNLLGIDQLKDFRARAFPNCAP